MNRTQIYLPEIQHTALKQIATERNIAMSEVIRHAIDLYLESQQSTPTSSFTLKKKLPGNMKGGIVIIPPELWDEYIEVKNYE